MNVSQFELCVVLSLSKKSCTHSAKGVEGNIVFGQGPIIQGSKKTWSLPGMISWTHSEDIFRANSISCLQNSLCPKVIARCFGHAEGWR